MPNSSPNFDKLLYAFERTLVVSSGCSTDEALERSRAAFVEVVAVGCGIAVAPKQISTLLQMAAEATRARRDAAILTVRAMSIDDLLPTYSDATLARSVVQLIELGLPDLTKALKLSEKRQTFEKYDALRGFHQSVCDGLKILSELPSALHEIDSLKSEILRATRKEVVSSYLYLYGWIAIKNKITAICDQVGELVSCHDSSYKARFTQLQTSCEEADALVEGDSFVSREFVIPFLTTIRQALAALKNGSSAQFACTLEPRRKPPLIAEKRYPLHRVDGFFTITVPMVNTGPGMAVDVVVELDCGNGSAIAIDAEEVRLGDIPPGEFAVSFKAMVLQPASAVCMAMQVNWHQLFGEPQSVALDLHLAAQDSTVEWQSLEQLDPFSLEEADSTQFVGRAAKVQAIGNRLLKAQMSSTYITGQKRVGKTSLAKAVMRYVREKSVTPVQYETTYLEWGEYTTADARSTVMALGQQLYAFLDSHLPRDLVLATPNFDGSLAPLNLIAKTLETHAPHKRFIIVLDEFDEIHPEMYRFGPLAEVFFANLRTLAARKNLAFILVGGEKMPFIIGAQGDQLNKFVREPLDYFSRADEWTDFVQLVSGPIKELNWEDSALNELFSLTNGHPYYTKLLCAKVFSNAVTQRDTEVISRDVRYALNGRVSELDTNAFAHFWKDGINGEREESEVVELKRLRLLVAFGRAARQGSATRELVAQMITGTTMLPQEIGPLIDDFCRRDIMKEAGGVIRIELPIFDRWLQDVGVSKLISSTLADDLEAELRKANDLAYVTAKEIEVVIGTWPLYRGRQIGGEAVRAWLEQVEQPAEQRLLFTLLKNMRFVTMPQIHEALRHAHEVVARATPPRLRGNKVEKRRDLLVTYLDGAGKSGATYAKAYAKENGLLADCVVEPSRVLKKISIDYERPNAVVVVDDLAGTGRTISEALDRLLGEIAEELAAAKIPLFVMVLFATEDAQTKIEAKLRHYPGINAKLWIHHLVGDDNRAFPKNGIGFWSDAQQRDRAKALCTRLGAALYKEPLGYGGQSLLLAFPDTCPNNNLPVIFASKSGTGAWEALLQRPAS